MGFKRAMSIQNMYNVGGRVYKNSPDLHGKISDNTLLICVSVNGFI